MSKGKKKGAKPQKNDIKKTEKIEELENEEAVVSEEIEETEVSDKADEDMIEVETEVSEDEVSEEEEIKDKKKPVEKKSSSDSAEKQKWDKLSFAEKCKKDPVIPVSIILAFVMIVVAVIYFMLPNSKSPSMGITLDEFRSRYDSAEVATQLYANGMDIGINYTNYVDRTVTPSILGEKETFTVDSKYVDYFTGDASLILDAGLEGATRKNDSELAYIRVYVEYDFDPVWMIFANTLQALYPELSKFDALDIAIHTMNDFNGDGLYTCRGDIAFRLIPVKQVVDGAEKTYIVIEAVPKDAIDASQIGNTLEITANTSAVSEETTSMPETVT